EAARRLYVHYLGLSASLHHHAGQMQSEPIDLGRQGDDTEATSSRVLGLRLPFLRRYRWALCACLLSALATGLWLLGHHDPSPTALRPVVEAVVGEVEVESNGAAERLSGARELSVRDRVRVPSSSLAVLRYPDGSRVELRPDTSLTVVEAGEEDRTGRALLLE